MRVGLAVTSHASEALCSASFEDLVGVAPSRSEDVGGVEVGGTASGPDGGGPAALEVGARPTDPDGDGLYEDLNGNGRMDSDDVATFFEYKDESVVTDHVSKYDFNGNGRIDFDDVATLFKSL